MKQQRYIAKPNEFVEEGYRMFSGQAEAVSQKYHKYVGKSGLTWLVADSEYAAENVYVTNNKENSGGEGFAGSHLYMPLVDGSTFILKGGWHSNADALFDDTGVDVRDKYRTFVVLSKERAWTEDGTNRTIMRDVVYKDNGPTLGTYNRYLDLIKQHPEANFYLMESKGGGSNGPIHSSYR